MTGHNPRALAALVVAVSAIAFAAIFFRLAVPTHPLTAAAWRLSLAALLSSPFVLRGWRSGALTPAHLRAGLVAGVIYAVHFGAWVWSLGLTSVAASVTLVCITPLGLALWGVCEVVAITLYNALVWRALASSPANAPPRSPD